MPAALGEGGRSDPFLLNAIRRKMGFPEGPNGSPDQVIGTPKGVSFPFASMPSTSAPTSNPFLSKFSPSLPKTAYPDMPPASDPFGALKPLGDLAGGIGSAFGGAMEGASRLPVLGPVLRGMGALYGETVDPALGLIEKTAGDNAAQRAYDQNLKTLGGDRPSPFDVFAQTRALRAAHQASQDEARAVAADTSRSPFERALAGVQAGADVVAQNTLPVPGIGEGAGLLKAIQRRISGGPLARVAEDVRPVAPPPVATAPGPAGPLARRIAAHEAEVNPSGAANEAVLRARGVAFEPGTGGALKPNPFLETGQPVGTTVAPLPEPGSMGRGYNTETTFSQSPKPIQTLVAAADKEAGGFIEQRRGHISVPDMKRMASEIGADPSFVENVINAKPGTTMNAETFLETGQKIRDASARRLALQQQIIDAGGAEHAPTELKLAAFQAAVEQMSLQQSFAGSRSEWGRAGVALQQAVDNALVAKTQAAYDRALDFAGGRKNVDQIIGKLNEIWQGPGDDAAKSRSTYNYLQTLSQSSAFDKLKELWINSVLSSPITHEVNTISNLAFALMQPPTRLAAATSEAALTLGGKLRPREIYFAEVGPSALGALRGISVGLRRGLTIVRDGFSPEDVNKFSETGKIRNGPAIGGPVGRVLNMPGTMLTAEDAVFKSIARQSEISALAARQAAKEGLRGEAFARRTAELEASPTADMISAADKQAKYATFQSEADKATKALMQLRTESGVGTFVIPFIQTPMNLVKRGLEYSPAGYLRAFPTNGAERSMAIARATVGSAILTYFATKLLDGQMTAGVPKNKAEADAFYRSGKIPYAIKIGDQWIEYQRLEPMMTPVKWVASAYEAFRNGQDPTDSVTKAIGAVTGALKDSTYLSGIQNVIDAADDPSRFAEKFLTQVASGFIPFSGLLRNVAQSQDPYIHAPENPFQRIFQNIPGASTTVPPKLDVYGQPVRRGPLDTGLNAVIDLRKAGMPGDPSAQMVDEEIARVREHAPLSFTGFTGTTIDKKTAQGTTLDPKALSDRAQFRYQELAGNAEHDALVSLIASPKYGAMTWEEKAKAIDSTRTKAREQAQQQLASENRASGNPFLTMTTTGARPTPRPAANPFIQR